MPAFISICTIVLLLFIVIQDLRHREISWLLIPLLALVFIAQGIFNKNSTFQFKSFLINVSFIALQLLMLSVYYSVKNKKLTSVVNSFIGLGDILFFIVICIAFSPINYITFYISSLIFTLIVFIIYKMIVKNANDHIPLAGIMSGLMAILILIKQFWPQINFYDDSFIIQILTLS